MNWDVEVEPFAHERLHPSLTIAKQKFFGRFLQTSRNSERLL